MSNSHEQSHAPWHSRWQEGRIGFHREEPHDLLVQSWSGLGVAPGAAVFVPLCGKTHDMRWLVEQGHRVVGAELSEIAARDFFAEWGQVPDVRELGPFRCYEAGGVRILVGDVFEVEAEHAEGVGAIYDRAALVALEPELRARYIGRLSALLPAGSRGLLVGLEGLEPDDEGPPFSTPRDLLPALFGAEFDVQEAVPPDFTGEPEKRSLYEYAVKLTRR